MNRGLPMYGTLTSQFDEIKEVLYIQVCGMQNSWPTANRLYLFPETARSIGRSWWNWRGLVLPQWEIPRQKTSQFKGAERLTEEYSSWVHLICRLPRCNNLPYNFITGHQTLWHLYSSIFLSASSLPEDRQFALHSLLFQTSSLFSKTSIPLADPSLL